MCETETKKPRFREQLKKHYPVFVIMALVLVMAFMFIYLDMKIVRAANAACIGMCVSAKYDLGSQTAVEDCYTTCMRGY